VASVAAADTFPWLVLALPAGALADRFERGRLMAVTNMSRALVLVALALLVATGRIDLALLIALVFINGGARAIYYSASQATVPELVEPRSFAHANGLLSGTEAATEHLGGPILGTLAFSVARAFPFVADASAVGAAGLSLLGFRTQHPDRSSAHGSILDGARQLVRDRSLRLLVTLLAALAGLQGFVMGVLVIIATVDWGVPKELYGLFLAAGAVGNVPGALLADSFASRMGNVRTLIASALVSGIAYLVMGSAKGWLLAGICFAVVSFAVYAGSVVANSLRQRLSPRDLMGRIGAAWRGVVWGAFPIGSLIGGGLAVLGGLRLPLSRPTRPWSAPARPRPPSAQRPRPMAANPSPPRATVTDPPRPASPTRLCRRRQSAACTAGRVTGRSTGDGRRGTGADNASAGAGDRVTKGTARSGRSPTTGGESSRTTRSPS
jgi:MFS family permease